MTQLAAEAGLHRVEAVRLQVGELSGVEAVSYTHLDVYKRQWQSCAPVIFIWRV